jgi:hypothetical protein
MLRALTTPRNNRDTRQGTGIRKARAKRKQANKQKRHNTGEAKSEEESEAAKKKETENGTSKPLITLSLLFFFLLSLVTS